jgi:peptidoglycan/LPS O-acetylase OafA/YrhL
MSSDRTAVAASESWQPTHSVEHGSDQREPVLDGIRGVAVLLVLFHHVVILCGLDKTNFFDTALLAVGNSSWLGVDLFFVLSGYLITGILYEAKGSSRYFTSFYGRRFLRIFPLYYGFLLLFYLTAPVFLSPDAVEAVRAKQIWYWTYLSNVDVALYGWPDPTYLGHFWSLAIEEQFYLVWPLVVVALDRRKLMLVCVACFVTALALRTIVPILMDPLAVYVLAPTRMGTLTTGALVALLIRDPVGRIYLSRWAPVVACVGIAWLSLMFLVRRGLSEQDLTVQTVGYSEIELTFAALIATSLDRRTVPWLRHILSSAVLRFFGKYSYGLYVLHQPIMLWLAERGLQAGEFPLLLGSKLPGAIVFAIVTVGLSIVFALVSWYFWERPFLKMKRFLPYRAAGRSNVASQAG